MKQIFPLFLISGLLFISCTLKYNITQTPDDVYYSPVRGEGRIETKHEERGNSYQNSDDREIRMSRHDRRWHDMNNDYGYSYDPYHYGYSYGYYYNPYYYPLPVYITGTTPVNPKNSTPRTTNLSSYQFVNTTPVKPNSGPVQLPTRGRNYNNSNGSGIRDIFSSSSSGGSTSPRTYSPSSGNPGGATITRPARTKN